MTDKIVFNGQEYASVDAMPPDVRKQYDDVMQMLSDSDRSGLARRVINVKTSAKTRITVNGKEYHSAAELPPDLRAAYEKALAGATGGLAAASPTPADDDRASGRAWRIVMWVAGGLLIAWWVITRR